MKIEFTKQEVEKVMEIHEVEYVMEKHVLDLLATETHRELNLGNAVIKVNKAYLGDVTVEILSMEEETEDSDIEKEVETDGEKAGS